MEIRPKFRLDLQASEIHEYGEQKNIVLKDPAAEKYYRLSPWEYQLLKALDGTLTVEQAVAKLKPAGHYYSVEEARMIVAKAAQAGVLLGTGFGTARFQRDMQGRIAEGKKSRRLAGMYFLFIPLINPDRFLEKTLWVFEALANKWTLAMVAVLAPGALYMACAAALSVEQEYLFFFNIENLIYLWITIALAKLVHEFAHAYTAKRFGLRVPQMGIAFLIFFPLLYCNTTQAWQLADRKQRIAISAAGILAEATVAVLSTYVWWFSRPGIINSLAFYLMAVSFVSTFLFNANPLMRYDGYYLLSDVVGIPNLAVKGFTMVRYVFMNRVLGMAGTPNPAGSRRETFIFALYGASALCYRVFIYSAIVIGVYYRFNKLVGVLLAAVAFTSFVVLPLGRGVKGLYNKRAELQPRPFEGILFLVIIAAATFAFLMPVSSRSVYPCYLDSEMTQKLTVPLQTFVSNVFVREGAAANEGALLFQLDSTLLKSELLKKKIEQQITRTQLQLLLLNDSEMAQAAEKQVELEQLQHDIRLLEKDLDLAENGIVAPFSGLVTKLDHKVQDGFQPGKGAVVGEFRSLRESVVRILIPETDLHKVTTGQNVQIWFPVRSGEMFRGRIEEIKPYSEKDLKNSPFSSRFGGEIATEPKSETQADAPLDAYYICSVLFHNSGLFPLGITGRCVVESLPRSIFHRLMSHATKSLNRESLL